VTPFWALLPQLQFTQRTAMSITSTAPLTPPERGYGLSQGRLENSPSISSAVSWGAIVAGAAAAASLSLILLILGVGLGLSSVSPWARDSISATTFGVSTIVWLTLTQLLSAAMGGYLAGRLRTRWIDTPTDEVYFRDTAHGFLSWAVASLATAALLTSAIAATLSGGIQTGASVVGGVANTTASMAVSGTMVAEESRPMAYFVDSLFRRDGARLTRTAMPADASEQRMANEASEVARIFMNVSRTEPLPPEDVRYVAQLVAQRNGMSQQEAEKRVTDVYARAQTQLTHAEAAVKDGADQARQASAYAAIWIFVSLLIGAFVASLAATYGGRQRDA
jgi:hypothetical protein